MALRNSTFPITYTVKTSRSPGLLLVSRFFSGKGYGVCCSTVGQGEGLKCGLPHVKDFCSTVFTGDEVSGDAVKRHAQHHITTQHL